MTPPMLQRLANQPTPDKTLLQVIGRPNYGWRTPEQRPLDPFDMTLQDHVEATPPFRILEETLPDWEGRVSFTNGSSFAVSVHAEGGLDSLSDELSDDGGSGGSSYQSGESIYEDMFVCSPSKSTQVGVFSKEETNLLSQGLDWIEKSTQQQALVLLRHLLESGRLGENLENLHDVTLFYFMRKLGFTTTVCRSRNGMIRLIRDVEQSDWIPSNTPRTWWFNKKKYGNNFG